GIEITTFYVKAIDESGIASVIMDLSAIGGSETQKLRYNPPIDTWVYSTSTNVVGKFCLPVNVTDNAGNSNTSVCINLETLDVTPPTIMEALANPDTIKADGKETTTFYVRAKDESGIKSVTMDLSAIGGSPNQNLTNISGIWRYTTSTTKSGEFQLPVKVTDNAGNSNTSVKIALTALDVTSPTIIEARANPDTIIADGKETTTFIVRAKDESGIKSVTMDLSPIGGSPIQPLKYDNLTDQYLYTTSTTISGKFNLSVKVTDNAGNQNSTTIYLRAKALPEVKVIYPNGREEVWGIITLNASATDPDPDGFIKNVEFQYSANGGLTWISLGNYSSKSPPYYTLEWNTRTVADGSKYLIKAIATDDDGAKSGDTSDAGFTINNSKPECLINCQFNRTFVGFLISGETHKLDFISKGAIGINITLSSRNDLDLELYSNRTGKPVVGPKGIINSTGCKVYNGMDICYSGYVGGSEYIKINKTTEILDLKVSGYESGSYRVDLVYITTPSITIYTDKTSYKAGDTMYLGLNITNPSREVNRVSIEIWAETPSGGKYILIPKKTVTLNELLDYINPKFRTMTLPPVQSGTYQWHAELESITCKSTCKSTYNFEIVSTRGVDEKEEDLIPDFIRS
ncbi:MAG: Ig-like domain repeat protein, partial [Methanosarcinales archaeon]